MGVKDRFMPLTNTSADAAALTLLAHYDSVRVLVVLCGVPRSQQRVLSHDKRTLQKPWLNTKTNRHLDSQFEGGADTSAWPISIPAELLRTIWKCTSALSVIRSGTSRLSTLALRLPKKPILRVDSGGLCLLSGQEKHIEAFASLVYIAVSRANAHLDNSTCRFRKQWRVLLGARQAPIIGWVRG